MENQERELKRCKDGYDGMSGEEYFFYNYCRIDGKLPKKGTYNFKAMKEYLDKAQKMRDGYFIKARRKSYPFIHKTKEDLERDFPRTPDDCFGITFSDYQKAIPKFKFPLEDVLKVPIFYGTGGEIPYVEHEFNKIWDDSFKKEDMAKDISSTDNVRIVHNRTSNTVEIVTSFKEEVSAGVVEPVINKYIFERSEAEEILEALKKIGL